jgi:hypothetical protein
MTAFVGMQVKSYRGYGSRRKAYFGIVREVFPATPDREASVRVWEHSSGLTYTAPESTFVRSDVFTPDQVEKLLSA